MSTGLATGRHGVGLTRAEPGPWAACALVAVLAFAWSTWFGWHVVVVEGSLPNPNSFTRINRILASIEAGRILDYVPRDNSGVAVPLHWTHLLDIAITALAMPMVPFFGLANALRLAGALIGPLGLAALSLSAMYAARVATGGWRLAAVAGVTAALGTGALSYGALGRADHHVVLATLATLTLTFAWQSLARGARPARTAGLIAAMGMWISPEMLPFALLGWAIAITGDVLDNGRVGRRAGGCAITYLIVLAVALVLDPPATGLMAARIDRLSRPFVELAALMAAASLVAARWLPAGSSPWRATVLGGLVAAAAVVPWVIVYPQLLRGAEGVFSPEGWQRIWVSNGEIKSPLANSGNFAFYFMVAPAVLMIANAWLLTRHRRPRDVLVAVATVFILYLGYRYIRLTIYAQQAAAVALAIMFAQAMRAMPPPRLNLLAAITTLALAMFPWFGMVAFGDHQPALRKCDAQVAATALTPFAGRVVLSPYMDAPALIYFSRVITVAGPYHRAERRILDGLDAYEARDFAAAPPKAFLRTGAKAVLVCTREPQAPESLGAALAAGHPPAWLEERPLPEGTGYRLYAVR